MDGKSSLVVVAMDGSDISLFAFRKFAEEIMEPTNHVVAVLAGQKTDGMYAAAGPLDKSLVQTLIDAEELKMSDRMTKVKTLMDELKIKGDIVRAYGDPGRAIIEKAKELNASYIVTGSRGLGKIRKTLLGSVSSYLLHHSHIPVVVCKMTN